MEARGFSCTDLGRRRERNEDAVVVDEALGLFILCDGMGGHAAGDVASRLTADTIAAKLRDESEAIASVRLEDDDPAVLATLLSEAVWQACKVVHAAATSAAGRAGMGSTATVLLVAGDKAVMAHVGDSRLYLWRDGAAHQVSADHTITAELLAAGVLTPEEARGHVHRNVLTRAVGTQTTVRVDTLVLDALPGDRYLLCSDGLSDYLDGTEWLSSQLGSDDVAAIPAALVDFANESGGKDNTSTIVVEITAQDMPASLVVRASTDVNLKLGALTRAFVFRDLPMGDVARVLNACRVVRLAHGDELIAENEECAALYIMAEGGCELRRDGERVGRVEQGDIVGVTTLLAPRPARSTLRCHGGCLVLVLTREAFQLLVRTRPRLGVALLGRLGRGLARELEQVRGGAEHELDALF